MRILKIKNIKTCTFLLFVQSLFLGSVLHTQTVATLPTYHWAYDYLHQLRVRGYLTELNALQQPYLERDVLQSLIRLLDQIGQGKISATKQDQWRLDFLLKALQNPKRSTGLIFEPGIWADQSIHSVDEETKFYTQLRSQVGVGLGASLYFYNGIRLDQELLDDPTYTRKEWRGFAGFTEQSYVRFTHIPGQANDDLPVFQGRRITNLDHAKGGCDGAHFSVTIGRDFLNWGAGKTGRLLFSDYAQPLDQIAIDLKYKGLQFTILAAQLEKWGLSDSLAKKYGTRRANRYLSAHRLTINFKRQLYLGLTEALLYGGPDADWQLKYHNPLLYYHGELLNGGGSDGNGLLYLDLDWYPWRNWEFYGEILVDDFQLEKTGPGDLEPNEVGTIIGLRHGDMLGLKGSLVGLEYVRIANRTYNSPFEWEKFSYFNRPIGYLLGNNLDRWNCIVNYWVMKGLQVGFSFDYIRQGKGSILDAWDAPWMNRTLAEGYHEPFPYGVVEKSAVLTLNLKYHFRANALIESQMSYRSLENAGHQSGDTENGWKFFFRLHWDIGGIWSY